MGLKAVGGRRTDGAALARRFLLCCALFWLMLIAPPAVAASREPGALGEPCLLATPDHRSADRLFADRAAFDCHRSPTGFHGPVTWALFDGLRLRNDPVDPLMLRFTRHRFLDEAVYARFADGRVAAVQIDPSRRRHVMPSGMLSYRLPAGDQPITAILVREDGLQNQRGIAPHARVVPSSVAALQDIGLMLMYALCCGGVLALFVYNLSLYCVLRYGFILAYCCSSLAVFLVGFSLSGAIYMVFPTLASTRIEAAVLAALAFYAITVVWFMLSFIEHGRIGRWATRGIVTAAAVLGASALVRLIDDSFAWERVDQVYYAAMVLVLVGLVGSTLLAMSRGSHAARLYLLIWTVPVLSAVVRVLWGMGIIEEGGMFAEISPLFVLAFETLVSSLAVGWRIGQLRNERDVARGRERVFKLLAETDPLSGLLNRRAFLERTREGTHRKRLVLADIDRFKAVNDRYGHDVGDEVIRAVADALVRAAPTGAVVGRLGGEEFALLFDAAESADVGTVVREAVAAAPMPGRFAVTISVGVAESALLSDADWRTLYNAADTALYRAKRNGRNCVRYAPTSAVA